jgi:hypothetical protein
MPHPEEVRACMLQVIAKLDGNLQSRSVLQETANRLGGRLGHDLEEVVLTVFYDLLRTGHLAWGYNLSNPQAVVIISDKPIMHSTQETVPDYRAVVPDKGVIVTNQPKPRHVLTTRRDVDIIFKVQNNGNFTITTTN